jgi:hypothetical protein
MTTVLNMLLAAQGLWVRDFEIRFEHCCPTNGTSKA